MILFGDWLAGFCGRIQLELKFLITRFDLEPLPGVRKNTGDLSAALDFP